MNKVAGFETPEWAGSLAKRGGNAVMNTYGRYPLELVRGQGTRVWDSEGREYLDFVAGIAVSVLGHAHPKVVEAIQEAATGLLHVSNLYWTEPMVRLAERLTAAAGMDRAFFCNSGAEAVEAAIKLAKKARPGRSKLLVFDHSFHGRTLGALSCTAQEKYQAAFRPLLPGIVVLPFGDFASADAAIDADTMAVLVEPIQGEGGIRPAPRGWLLHLRELCDQHGALLLFDEVQTGLGRTGTLYAAAGEGVRPDAIASAKALAGGLPMGVLLAQGEAARAFVPGDHASTFGGGPLVASVANAVLDVVLEPGFLEDVQAKGAWLGAELRAMAWRNPAMVVEARGRGLMWGLQLTGSNAGRLVEHLHELGVLTVPAGKDVLRIVPPLTVTKEELREGLRRIESALKAVHIEQELREAVPAFAVA